MTDLSVYGINFKSALNEIGDPDDFSDTELKDKVTSYVKSNVSDEDLQGGVSVDDLVGELNDLMKAERDGVNSSGEEVESSKTTTSKEPEHANSEDIASTNSTTSVDKATTTDATAATEATSAATTDEAIAQLQKEIDTYQAQINENNSNIENLSAKISAMQEELQKEIEDAIKESEQIAKEQKDEAAKITKNALNDYIASKGEMSYEDFENGLSSKLDDLAGSANSSLSAAVKKILRAESKMADVSAMLNQMNGYIEENVALNQKIDIAQGGIDELKKKAEEEKNSCTDPIGFKAGDMQYDFFVDSDNDGKLSNKNEFLGSSDGWSAMTNLDTDGDGKISSDEMKDLKLVATDSSGKQSVVDAANIFKDSDFIDLGSYDEINSKMDNGNTLLGTFGLNISGDELSGYNTYDQDSWLSENYQFSDDENKNTTVNDTYRQDYESYQELQRTLESKIENAWANIGVNRNDIKSEIDSLYQSGKLQGQSIAIAKDDMNSTDKKEEEKVDETKEAETAETTDENLTEEEKKKLEEEQE